MKGIILVMTITFGAGLLTGKLLFQGAAAGHGLAPLSSMSSMSSMSDEYLAPITSAELSLPATTKFQCDGRQHCSQMTSKAEAQFFLENCPETKMDGDNDGEACERQF